MGNCLQCFQSSSSPSQAAQACSTPTTGANSNTFACTNLNDGRSVGPHETDELLSARTPLKITNHCDTTTRNSFKKSLALLPNGNVNNISNMSDIINTVKDTSLFVVSDNTLNKLFEEYKDAEEEDMILPEGIERLCRDLNYQPDEFAILVLAWCLDASQMCRFTKMEFIQGLHKMCADSIDTIRIRLEQTIEMLKVDAEMFKQLYRFTFRFGLEPDQRILSLDMAISLWKLVFTVHTPALLGNWLLFLEQNPSIRGIPKDSWNMFLNFVEQCDINNYDDTEAWPSLFDDFVDYEKSRLDMQQQSSHCYQDDDNNNDNTNDDDMLQSQQRQRQEQQQQQQHKQPTAVHSTYDVL